MAEEQDQSGEKEFEATEERLRQARPAVQSASFRDTQSGSPVAPVAE